MDNLDQIKCADWKLTLVLKAEEKKEGMIMFDGTPEDMVKKGQGYTAKFLKKKLQ